MQDQRRKGDRHLQLHAVEPLSFCLSGRAGRVARAQGNQLLRLEPLRRPALRGVGLVAATRLGLAFRRLERTHHGRGQLRRQVALPRRFPEVLCLEARSRRPGRTDHRRRGRIDEPLRRTHQERLRARPGPQVRLCQEQPVRPLRQQGLLAGPGAVELRRRVGGRDRRAEDAPSRRARRRLGGHRPRRPWLLGRRQPGPRFLAYQYLGRGARRLVLGRQQEAARAHLRRSQGHAQRPGHRAGAGAVRHEQAGTQLRQRHAQLCSRLLQRRRAQVVCRGGKREVRRQLARSRRRAASRAWSWSIWPAPTS